MSEDATCKWCDQPPREGDNVCEQCRSNLASMSSALVARDASVDAPLWNHEQYDREIKTLNKALRSELATVDRLRADLAAANEEIARLRDEVGEWQDASGLCVPAEEHGGDPGGVRPRHLAMDIERRDAELAATKAKLGRAVTMLDWAMSKLAAEHRLTPEWRESYAILADTDCTQAAEAWTKFMEAARELRDHEATCCITVPACGNCIACRFNAALAAVDARRGGGR